MNTFDKPRHWGADLALREARKQFNRTTPGARHSDDSTRNYTVGKIVGLYWADALDQVDYWAVINEIDFLCFRANERHLEQVAAGKERGL